MSQLDVSVIIVHRNGAGLLGDCIRSIVEKTRDACYEIVVVDNGSADGSAVTIQRDFPSIRVIRSEKNLGYSRGNNLGACESTGKYLLLLNNDTVFLNDAVGMFLRFSEGHTELRLGALGGFLLTAEGGAVHSMGRFPGPLSQFRVSLENLGILKTERRFREAAQTSSRQWFEVDFLTGAALFVPRAVFTELGGFDGSFFLYFEETELQLRMARAGYLRCLLKGPRIVHLGGGSASRSAWRRTETYRGLFLYYRVTQGPAALLLFRLVAPLFVVVHLLHPAFSPRENLAFVRFCFAQLRSPDTGVRESR